jgi:ABC-2 type transport system permease protein
MGTYLRLELARTASDRRFLILVLVWPVAMYLLFTNLFGASGPGADGLDGNVEAMVSMAAFGAFGAALTATAPRIAQERTNGWFRQMRVLPMPAWTVVLVKMLAGMVAAAPSIVLVGATAVLAHGVSLAAWQWAAIGGLLWIGTAPFAALGVLIGHVTDDSSSFAITYGLYLGMSAIGGLWIPVALLPTVLQDIAPALPSNRLAELGWRVAGGHAPSLAGALVLAGWLVLFAALAALVHRRATVVP